MYILDFLRGFESSRPKEVVVTFDYRLLCSGELYNGDVLTGDWRKSDASRILLHGPIRLFVCSHPFDEFPQELALQFSAPLVTEEYGNEEHGKRFFLFHPDGEIASDLAAVMTMLCRRLITVAGKIREVYPPGSGQPSFLLDWPVGFVKTLNLAHWRSKPATVIYGFDGIKIEDNNPPPLPVDHKLGYLLFDLPKLPSAESIVQSARLYSLALQQLEHNVDIAYQLLVAAVETVANEALREYTPTMDEMIATKRSVAIRGVELGLSEDQAQQLALEACKGIPWASRKFSKFIMDNATDDLWKEDDLFKLGAESLPAKENFRSALQDIYNARNKLLHSGRPFPLSSVIGIGPTAPSRAFSSFDLSTKPFPPIVWFERVVSHTIRTFLERSLRSDANDVPSTA